MGKKKERVENELQEGSLTHNPFAALGGGGGSSAPTPPAQRPANSAGKGPAKGSGKSAAKSAPKPAGGGATARPGGPRRSPAAPAPAGKLVVRFEAKGHGGKQVTRVSGLALEGAALEALAKSARKGLGVGARVEGDDVLIQGKLQDRVIAWLAKNGHPGAARGN